ncbi:MAG: riboflavin synthase [Candidatus Omnitrophica bacterium]|nr:riboflavin synthase [Candidatus Omnitrophota bacterium]
MFTGIVQTKGTVLSRRKDRLLVRPERPLFKACPGDSICVEGVCLTIDRLKGPALEFRLLPETQRATTLGALREGQKVNLEPSLRVGQKLGGHLLLGHVDGQGTILRRIKTGSSETLEIAIPGGLSGFLIPKGPIAVDGISLTLDSAIGWDKVRVHLIPFTREQTSIGNKPVGSKVNIELDLVAKYLWRILGPSVNS